MTDFVEEFYNRAANYSDVTSRFHKVIEICRKTISNRSEQKSVVNVLDIGCSCGIYGDVLKKEFGNAVNIVGIDINKRTLPKSMFYSEILSLNLNKADSLFSYCEMGLPQPDLIICSEVLQCLFNPEIVYRFFDSVLAPLGIIVVTTPNYDWWLKDHSASEMLYDDTLPYSKQNIRHFNIHTHSKYFNKNNLSILSVNGADSEYCDYTRDVVDKLFIEFGIDKLSLHQAIQQVYPVKQHTLVITAHRTL